MNKYRLITIKELNILFLEYKYNAIKPSTYSSYQFKAKVVNEYLGNVLVINLDLLKIRKFKTYLYSRKWEYIEQGSKKSINSVMSYLFQLLTMAKKWKIIDKIEYIKNNDNIEESSYFIERRNNYLIETELKRASNKLDNMLNNN